MREAMDSAVPSVANCKIFAEEISNKVSRVVFASAVNASYVTMQTLLCLLNFLRKMYYSKFLGPNQSHGPVDGKIG